MGRKLAGVVLVGVMVLTAACGGGDDGDSSDASGSDEQTETAAEVVKDASGIGDSGGTLPTPQAGASSDAPACDLLDDSEAQAIFGGAVTKEAAAGNSCNVTGPNGEFATYKFEVSSDLDEARKTIEETFEVKTKDESFGDRSFSFERDTLRGLTVLKDGRMASLGGNFEIAKLGELALAIY